MGDNIMKKVMNNGVLMSSKVYEKAELMLHYAKEMRRISFQCRAIPFFFSHHSFKGETMLLFQELWRCLSHFVVLLNFQQFCHHPLTFTLIK